MSSRKMHYRRLHAEEVSSGSIRSAGFTLVELLVALGIAVAMIGTVVAALAGGIRVWEMAQHTGGVETDTAFALEQFEIDLRNSPPFYALPFLGEEFEFTALRMVDMRENADEDARPFLWYRYRYNRQSGKLTRYSAYWPSPQMDYPVQEVVLEGIAELTFAYYAVPEEGQPFSAPLSNWNDATNLPFVVEMSLAFERGQAITRKVMLPLAAVGGE